MLTLVLQRIADFSQDLLDLARSGLQPFASCTNLTDHTEKTYDEQNPESDGVFVHNDVSRNLNLNGKNGLSYALGRNH
jgi:hypothetical protein